MFDSIIRWFNSLGAIALSKLLPCLLIAIVGIVAIRVVMTIIKKTLEKSKLEKAAHSLITSVVSVVLYALLALIAASSLGIDVTGVVALASVASLAISLALQNSLTNLIGGFTLLYTRPFRSGDYVEIAGQSGTVKEIGMAYTKLITPDNKLVSIPNAAVVAAEIVNFSITGTRRVDVNVSASYDSDMEAVLAALKEAGNVDKILPEQGVFAAVTSYGDSAINYTLRVWCATDDYWDVTFAVNQRVQAAFAKNNVVMTYPHLNVHLDK